jgi:hypothetical protein
MVLLIPSLVLFSAAGIEEIARWSAARSPIAVVRVGLAAALITAFGVESFALPLQVRNAGYEALVQDVVARLSNVPQIWLVSSDSTGEGSLVAAVAVGETRPGSYVLRGKTILAGGDWFWRNTEDRFATPEKLAAILDELSVTIIVIDDRVAPDQQRPYHERLKKLVAGRGDRWELIGSYPQTRDGVVVTNSLHVYARRPVASLSFVAPVIPLERLKALMIRKELR